ncbi:NAD-dependent epimerase/dehydratase family protein [Glycomyces buryatensis]|uniref:NAD-dependent epimerase/dehydratase family protein n=1 Tax=Glycomyces buryatensis TaxID=2570927 RepID=A0A4S8Q7G6_9ACTN|nr:NAD-dependent epimerase/dehydratase family protein [Glycomyces buryatensis]THV38615.1 NAD-dependent epimerase/dehydratase family protein [Glycomyces buryatensis]
MTDHVILGKGQIGSTVAAILAERGESVRVLSRSGGTDTPGITHIKVDARDAAALTAASAGADVFYNCANPGGYHRWAEEWPPMFAAILAAAKANGASLVQTGNLYGYGPVSEPMHERTPLRSPGHKGRLRIQMWKDALALHEAGDIRFTEARGSDFFGPGALADAMLGERFVRPLIEGKHLSIVGDPDAPHTFTYIPDVARTLVRLAGDDRSWGRPWHVPSAPAVSQREMAEIVCRLLGRDPAVIRRLPWWVLIRVIGTFQPAMRGMTETRHQWDGPYIMESSDFTSTFGDEPTDTETALGETIEWWQRRLVPA